MEFGPKLFSKAIQYEIGNPLTAERMTRHVLAAGLYAPLRVYSKNRPEGTAPCPVVELNGLAAGVGGIATARGRRRCES